MYNRILFRSIGSILLCALSVVFLLPIVIVAINSFKGQFFIAESPFSLPDSSTFAGLTNYITGITKTGFVSAFL